MIHPLVSRIGADETAFEASAIDPESAAEGFRLGMGGSPSSSPRVTGCRGHPNRAASPPWKSRCSVLEGGAEASHSIRPISSLSRSPERADDRLAGCRRSGGRYGTGEQPRHRQNPRHTSHTNFCGNSTSSLTRRTASAHSRHTRHLHEYRSSAHTRIAKPSSWN